MSQEFGQKKMSQRKLIRNIYFVDLFLVLS